MHFRLQKLAAEKGNALAIIHLNKTISKDSASAQMLNNLGTAHRDGDGVPQDYVKALTFYKHAAAEGSASANYNLGAMYCSGIGVPEDRAEGCKWLQSGAEQGCAMAADFLDGLQCHNYLPLPLPGTASPAAAALESCSAPTTRA